LDTQAPVTPQSAADDSSCAGFISGKKEGLRRRAWLPIGSTNILVIVIAAAVGGWLVNPLRSQGLPPRPDSLRGGASSVSSSTSSDLQVVSTILPTGVQQIVVTDPKARVMAVYHVDAAQGKLQLKSVRSLRWDLGMEEFNGESPLPSELRVLQQ